MANVFPAIFWAGLACGVLDITAAFLTWAPQGVKPITLLQGIASGVLGPKSLNGGWATAALGAACHFFIAFAAATVFYVASRTLPVLIVRPIFSSVGYGLAVYVVMYWIVMPLSRVRRRPFSWRATAIAVLTHMVCVGTPIVQVVRYYAQ